MDDTSYKGASLSAKELLSWRPLRHSADVELDGELSTLVARSRDLIRNNGIASGAIQTLVDNVVGNGLKLVSIPDHRILGLDLDYLEEWARKVESLWRIWSESVYCDAARKLNFNSQTALIFRSVIENGEALALVLWRENQANQFATCFQLIEPDRLSNPDFKQNTEFLRDGIEINHYGEPQNYWISKYYPNDYYYHGNTNSWEKVAAQTSFGRKLILHIHHPERIGQNRGKPLFTSIMPLFKMLDHYERSELKASVVNANFYENKAAWCRCKWIGPGRGWVDPVKEAQASQIRMESGLSTLEDECASQGLDWEEVLMQRVRELKGLDFPLEFNGLVELDYYMFGLLYWVLFKKCSLDLSKKEELKRKLNEKIVLHKEEYRSTRLLGSIRRRLKDSIDLYEDFLEN